MSAFGQAGFGSSNRRRQLQAQGQMDPYGQQVRAAKQAPTFNIYQTQQPAQQPAQQQAKPPATPAAPAMQAYSTGQTAQPTATPGTAQPIQPQTQGTPYAQPPKQDWLQSMSDEELKKSLSNWTAAGTSGPAGQFNAANSQAARAELARRGQTFDAVGARRQQLQGDIDRIDRQIQDWNDRAAPGSPRIGETFLVDGRPDDQWMQANQYWANQRRQAQSALDAYNTENPVIQTGGPGRTMPTELQAPQTGGPGRPAPNDRHAGYFDGDTWIETGGPGRMAPGMAQPIQPQSQGTPYGADPGYADRVAAAAQQWNNTPAGSQKRDWGGNTVRSMLSRGLSPDMASNVLSTNSTQFAGNPAGAAQFANQTEQNWIASLSPGMPQAPGPNATAAEHSAFLNASNAYAKQQDAQRGRDARLAAEAAFNDPERVAAGARPTGEYYNSRGQQFNGLIRNPSSAYRMDASGNLVPYSNRDASGMSMDVVRASQGMQQRIDQNNDYLRQLYATNGVALGPNQQWMQPALQPNAPRQIYEVAGYGVGTDGKTMQPIYQPAKGGTTLRSQALPGQAQPIQPQTQGTPYPTPQTRSIEENMAADAAMERQNGWWAQEASRRGVDPMTNAPLANRTAEQAAYQTAAYSPQNDQLPPQDESILAYLRQRDAPKQPAQPQQLYRTAMNAGVPGQQLAFEQDAFRNMAQRAVDREAFHGANDPYVQQFVNRMQYQGFDPRQGLTASQHIQDALAVRQRNNAIRANPMAYLRGEL